MKRNETKVHHWRYDDGWQETPLILKKLNPARPDREFNEYLVGWHCWVYAEDDDKFEAWMKHTMKGKYDVTRRFNSGDPMSTVWINLDEDATLFKLMWM